jgi:hypothetical protein
MWLVSLVGALQGWLLKDAEQALAAAATGSGGGSGGACVWWPVQSSRSSVCAHKIFDCPPSFLVDALGFPCFLLCVSVVPRLSEGEVSSASNATHTVAQQVLLPASLGPCFQASLAWPRLDVHRLLDYF